VKREILGQSKAIRDLLAMIKRVAPNKTGVLIIGESGTGKELVARKIHEDGPLADKPFVAVNCGAIPETLIESEMFGHKRGSFTGAVSEKMGLFEAAHHGTLFLDEIGELPLSMQVKLLRVIQERSFRKVGGTEDIKVDVRLIAATNRDLAEMVALGKFREDLYYRLNVILLKTPPLRDRVDDIELLAKTFLDRNAKKQNKAIDGFDPEVLEVFRSYRWPGNIRELENTLERAVTLEHGSRISMKSLPATLSVKSANTGTSQSEYERSPLMVLERHDFSKGALNLDEILHRVEGAYLQLALQAAGGIRKKAADLLGITFRSMRYRLKKQGLSATDSGEESED
jgi:two-component system response regulator PilR (NtrC family)